MEQTLYKTITEAIKYWWLFLLSGMVLLAVGIWVIASPVQAYLSLTLLFAISILMAGVFETVFAAAASRWMRGWGWLLAGGLLDLVIAVYLLAYPIVTMAVLPFILGFWLLFRGFNAIAFSFDMKSFGDSNWGWYLLLAIGIVVFALMILAVPAFGVASLVTWTSLSFILAGIYRMVVAFELRKLKKH